MNEGKLAISLIDNGVPADLSQRMDSLTDYWVEGLNVAVSVEELNEEYVVLHHTLPTGEVHGWHQYFKLN